MNSSEAYIEALESGYTKEFEGIACKDPDEAYWFAHTIKEADIEYFQEKACKNPRWAYWFARDIPGADINYCLEACKGTKYHAKMQFHIMEEAIG